MTVTRMSRRYSRVTVTEKGRDNERDIGRYVRRESRCPIRTDPNRPHLLLSFGCLKGASDQIQSHRYLGEPAAPIGFGFDG